MYHTNALWNTKNMTRTYKQPLAERMRPSRIEDLVGQNTALGPDSWLVQAIQADSIPSLVLWGPPGCGKTSLANVIEQNTRHLFVRFSAIKGGVREVRAVIGEAQKNLKSFGKRTILFVDEIHHFTKTQQDAFLPFVEDGTIILIAATTENPSFNIISPLLSRCRLVVLDALTPRAIEEITRRALADPVKGLGEFNIQIQDDAVALIGRVAGGDARQALNILEIAARMAWKRADHTITTKEVQDSVTGTGTRYDRHGEEHYNVVSAFIKSMRGSDPDAALYYMMRMLENGEEPRFILRRMLIFASEDIGNADPQALQVAVAAFHAFEAVGLPEGRIPMAQAVTYLATAPKSNASYLAMKAAARVVQNTGPLNVPLHLRNPVTKLMQEQGYGDGYRYPHDEPAHYAPGVVYLPDKIAKLRFYEPSDQGYESRIKELIMARRQQDKDADKDKKG